MSNKTNKAPRNICPKLVCCLTGATRVTNKEYLAKKAERLGVSVGEVVENYVSKEAVALLKSGQTFGLMSNKVAKLIKLNSKAPVIKVKVVKAKKAAKEAVQS